MAVAGAVLFKRGEQSSDYDEIWDDTALIEAYDRAVSSAKEAISQRRKKSQSESLSETGSNIVTPGNNQNRRRCRGNNKKYESESKPQCWNVGDQCRAVYSCDGKTYEAEIMSVNAKEEKYLVQFIGYENSEEVILQQLQPSEGHQARLLQIQESQTSHHQHIENSKKTKTKHKHKQQRKTDQNLEYNYSHYQNGSKTEKQKRSSSQSFKNFPAFDGIPGTSKQSFFMQTPPLSFQPWASLPSIPPMEIPPPPLPVPDDIEEDDEALSSMLMAWYMSGYHTGYYQGLKLGRSRAANLYHTPSGSGSPSPAYSRKFNKFHH